MKQIVPKISIKNRVPAQAKVTAKSALMGKSTIAKASRGIGKSKVVTRYSR